MEKEFDQNKKFVPTKSFSEYVEEWKNGKKDENPFMQTATIEQLETRIKELEGTIENNVTEVSEFFNDGIEIFECNSCGMLMEENEPYNNYCPNCGRKIKK